MTTPHTKRGLSSAAVVLECSSGDRTELHAGDQIGRAAQAALLIDDPRVSEAHAMVSLRRGRLFLLALRRLIAVDGTPQREVELEPGLRVALAQGLDVVVHSIRLPGSALTVGAPPTIPMRRLASVASFFGAPRPRVVSRFEPDAPGHAWSVGGQWRIRLGRSPVCAVGPGDRVTIDDVEFRFAEEPLGVGAKSTLQEGGVDPPVRLITFYDGVEIHRGEQSPVLLSGLSARLLTELGAFGMPVEWQLVAREVWRDEPALSEGSLRRRWDVALSRLRKRLQSAGLRRTLVHADGHGLVHLALREHDRLERRE